MKTFLLAVSLVVALAFSVSAQINTANQIAKSAARQSSISTETLGPTNLSLSGGPFEQLTITSEDAKKSTKPEPKKTPPASVEFDKAQADAAERLRDKAKLAATEAENLALKLERAQTEYQKLREGAASAQTAYVEYLRNTAEKLGIPKEELPNYEFSDAGGKFTLKRKESAKTDTSEQKTENKGGN